MHTKTNIWVQDSIANTPVENIPGSFYTTYKFISKTLSFTMTKSMMAIWKEHLCVQNIDAAAIVVQTSTEEIVHKVLFSLSKRKGKKVIDELIDMLYRYLFND